MDYPKHVGVIMDGNRRWAKKMNLEPWEGHKAGKETLKKLINYFLDSKVQYLTLYSLSLDNFNKRSSIERKHLYEVIKSGFDEIVESDLVKKRKLCIKVIGKWWLLPEDIKTSIEKAIEVTKNNKGKIVTFAICYDGQDEVVEACKEIVKKGIPTDKINLKVFYENMYSKDLPPVDLIIRTGGEKRLSGFMLWSASYAELYFTEVLFPDAVPETFELAIKDFSQRKRRFGK